MNTKSLTLTDSRDRSAEALAAFKKFLEGLKVPVPRQLILINPQVVPEQFFDLHTARNRAYFGYPPVGLLYIAAVAKEINPDIDVRVLDLNYELLRRSQSDDFDYNVWKEILSETISACDAPHIGVTYMFGTTKENYVDVSRFIRENFPGLPLLTGGVQATYDYKEILERDLCDIVFRNEGELQFKSFLESCIAGKPVDAPWGCAFKQDGVIHELGESQKDVPMDWDIRPFYDQLDISNYHQVSALGFSRFNGAEKSFATVITNRGCRARCTFCTVRDFNGFGIRLRSVNNVVDEVKFLLREKGVQQIDFLDDDMLWNPKRAVELLQRLAAEVPELVWTSSNGLIAAPITEELMHWMAESGLTAFKIGIESGNDQMLHLIKKPTTKPKLREKRELFRKYPDVFVVANFIIGFPNETFSQMMDSFNFAAELKWDWCTWNICQPLKGTEVWSAFRELGDDRCDEDAYTNTLNPGRSTPKAEVGYVFEGNRADLRTGMDIFNLPYDEVPSSDQLREIWFTFNLVTNFLSNTNFESGGNPAKLLKWLEAIHSGYPYDASMCAALVKGYQLLDEEEKATFYQEKFKTLLAESGYWKKRIEDFPELLTLADVASSQTGARSGGAVGPREGAVLPHVPR
jgi:radical SAM superfamily enzyme YgiQ (UPF0313 family)